LPACQFAERFAVAHRGGKLRAEADSVNSMRPDAPNQLVAAGSDRSRFRLRENFLEHTSSFFAPGRALHFLSQENFFSAIENKIHFFLVDFATDF
jgi:hypothetical protein